MVQGPRVALAVALAVALPASYVWLCGLVQLLPVFKGMGNTARTVQRAPLKTSKFPNRATFSFMKLPDREVCAGFGVIVALHGACV